VSAPIAARTAGDTCVRCRKKFQPADRVQVCNIVVKTGTGRNALEVGAFLSHEFELAHVNCADAQLEKAGVLITS
jgi:hypothetical protein